MGEFPSGQRGQTVNLLSVTSVVRIHLPPPKNRLVFTSRFFLSIAKAMEYPRQRHCRCRISPSGLYIIRRKVSCGCKVRLRHDRAERHFVCSTNQSAGCFNGWQAQTPASISYPFRPPIFEASVRTGWHCLFPVY